MLLLPFAHDTALFIYLRMQQVMHSVLACRMMLRLRQYDKRTVRGDGFTDLSMQLSVGNDATMVSQGPLQFAHGDSSENEEELRASMSRQFNSP